MAVNGKVNSLLTEQLHQLGVNAFGLSGMDGRSSMIGYAQRFRSRAWRTGKRKIIRDDYTGKIETGQC